MTQYKMAGLNSILKNVFCHTFNVTEEIYVLVYSKTLAVFKQARNTGTRFYPQ